MRTLPAELAAHLASGATTLCHCWRIARADGVVLGFTDHDRPIEFDGLAFAPETGADGARFEATADLAVDNSEIAGALNDDRLSAADLAAGLYDGATVDVWRLNWADPAQRVHLRAGVLGETSRENDHFRAEIRGPAHALSRTVGRVYQRACDALVGDARCGVNLNSPAYRAEGVVVAATADNAFTATGLDGFSDGWFDYGLLNWSAGQNAGTKAHVKTHINGDAAARLALWLPAGVAIAAGDAFTVTAGCDRAFATCRDKFSNTVSFRGFHLMPGNDFAVSYPSRADQNDGGRR